MIKISSSRLLALMLFILSVGIITSCDKDDDEVTSDKIQLFSFGPTGAKHGDTIRFIGVNLNKVTAIQFTGTNATVNQSDFKTQTSDLIKVIVPQGAEQGYVTLKTPEGDIVTKTKFNLDVLTTVTSITAQARPGQNVTITGTFLNWVDRVTFSRDKTVDIFVSKTQTQLVVKVPDDAETGPLVLHYAGTDSNYVQTADTLKVTLPLTTSMSPNPVKPLTNVTITGTDLDLAKKVIFVGASAPVTTFVSQTATQLVVQVPNTAKKGKLTLEAASGVKTISSNDLDIVLPVITSFSPSPINLAADLTITGTDLDLVKKVIFSGVAPAVTTFVSQSTTQLVVKVPAGARKGKIKVEAASGVQTTSSGDLDVILPTIASMSPNPIAPGGQLTVTGTKLDIVNSVTFENAPAVTSFVSQSATQIIVAVPNGVLRGKITLGIINPTDTIRSADILEIIGAAPPPVVALPFYNDAITANWNGWLGGGWGGTKDLNNPSPVREGTKSCKIDYSGGWGSPLQLGGANISLSPYTTFKISIFGGAGTAGKKISIVFNGNNTVANGIPAGSATSVSNYTITLGAEGQWTDYAIPFPSFSAGSTTTTLQEIWIQEYNGTGGFTIYIDAMGLN